MSSASTYSQQNAAFVDNAAQESGKRHRCSPEGSPSNDARSLKRARASSSSSEVDSTEVEMAMESGEVCAKRDPEYYFSDGSSIFRVEDTLFNVHRSLLSRDPSSSFAALFSLPQGDQPSEGLTDDNPIRLSGDSVTEFRNFLWAIYALPNDLRAPNTNISRLIDVARVANKYTFKSLESWALESLLEYVNRKPSPLLSNTLPSINASTSATPFHDPTRSSKSITSSQNIEELTKLIRLAQMCCHKPLLDTMISNLKQLMGLSVKYAYLALTLADELDLRSLRGAASLEVMQKTTIVPRTGIDDILDSSALLSINDATNSSSSNSTSSLAGAVGNNQATASTSTSQESVDLDPGEFALTPGQQLRLLSGYYRLTRIWERLRSSPPSFDHTPACGANWHQQGCTQSWLEFWKERIKTDAVVSLGPADVVGRLKQVQKEYDKWGSAPYMHHECRNSARRSIQEVIKKIEDALPDFFSGDDA